MTARRLERKDWQRYFDALSRHLKATNVNVLIGGLDLGLQPAAQGLPLIGITFDSQDDALEIATETIGHRISRPREIDVEEDATGRLQSLDVRDAEGHTSVVQIEPALLVHQGS